MRLKFFENQSAAGALGTFDLRNSTRSCVFVVFSTGVSGGTVLVECAHDPNYGGTWHQVASISGSGNAGKTVRTALDGAFGAVRVRISSAITGGTASAYLIASR